MNRKQVLKQIKQAAKDAGLDYWTEELTRHTGVHVGDKQSTLARHNEVANVARDSFFKQFESVLGEDWWKK